MFNSIWYENLTRPFLSPPKWLFVPVWGILYLTIFISFILYFLKKDKNKRKGYIYFSIQIILNFLWTPAFFGAKNILLALIIIILLDIFLILTIKNFYPTSKIASLLLIPYLIWTIFATYLNFSYFILN